ncbi:anaerobic ribonucleoside-triphosphate reductase [bacterium]|nr:anaerobic ribonucleoside-triphosphate reductase [bacterium]
MRTNEILQASKTKRTKCIVYTRVMGYHRPIESFNIGKVGEHRQRTYFIENETCLEKAHL